MRSRSRVPSLLLVACGVALIAVAGCRGGATTIKMLLDDPARFDGKEVRIAGQVGASAGFLGYGAYQVNDGTGTIPVVSQGGGAPREGATVGVQGTFRSVYTLGTQSVAVILESRRFTP